jgi:hypothetical protein
VGDDAGARLVHDGHGLPRSDAEIIAVAGFGVIAAGSPKRITLTVGTDAVGAGDAPALAIYGSDKATEQAAGILGRREQSRK